MQRKFKIMLVCFAIPVALFFTHIIGVLTFYRTVVPFLGPVLPRPYGVPSDAEASFNWKAFGLFWKWESKLHSGCASWGAAKTLNYSNVRLATGGTDCKSASLTLHYTAGDDDYTTGDDDFVFYNDQIVLNRSEWSRGEPCPFKISNEQLADFAKLIFETKQEANKGIEQRALSQIEAHFAVIDGHNLTTHHSSGCSNGSKFNKAADQTPSRSP